MSWTNVLLILLGVAASAACYWRGRIVGMQRGLSVTFTPDEAGIESSVEPDGSRTLTMTLTKHLPSLEWPGPSLDWVSLHMPTTEALKKSQREVQ